MFSIYILYINYRRMSYSEQLLKAALENAMDIMNAKKAEEERQMRIKKEDEQRKKRCNQCRKKLGLTSFACRCGYYYCATHRLPEEHSCSFDYKMNGRNELNKINVLVTGDKMDDRI